MIALNDFVGNYELYELACKNKNIKLDTKSALVLAQNLGKLKPELEKKQASMNNAAAQMAKISPEGRKIKALELKDLKAEIENLKNELRKEESKLNEFMLRMPSLPAEDVPVGLDENENQVLYKVGELPTKEIKDHLSYAQGRDWVDIERGVKVAGSRSYLLKGQLAELERAILALCREQLRSKSYKEIKVPVLVKNECMEGTGYFPAGKDQAYQCEADEMSLVGTSEVVLTSLSRDEILKKEDLPLKLFAESMCFRREAGTYGKDTKGLYRVHQFQKVEQVIVDEAEEKRAEGNHKELLKNAEEIMQKLELPYRVSYLCTGDLGQGQIKKHDIEAWMPSRKAYGETHSCSSFGDFQARRLKMRYKDNQGKNTLCYTFNNTAVASPRILIPFLEIHQKENGKLHIPEALRVYLKPFFGDVEEL